MVSRRVSGRRLAATLLGVGVALIAAPAAQAKPARLVVRVTGLPPGTHASLALRGPGLTRRLRGSHTFTRVRPGTYTLTVRRVRIGGAHRRVRAGSIALPAVSKKRARVRAGRTARVKAAYGTIVNANVKRPSLGRFTVRGNAVSPSALVLSSSHRVRVGTILTGKPSAKLPAGLFHRVTAVRRSGHKLVVSLRPARLAQAFPQLDIDSQLHMGPSAVATGSAHAAKLDPLVASLGIDNFRCSLPLADSFITARESFGVDAGIQLHIPTFFGVPVGLPDGQIWMSLQGSAGLDSLIRKNTGCSANLQLPPLAGAIPVGPVVVPVYVRVGVSGTASIDSDLHQHAAAGFFLRAGMAFHGTHVDNISTASAHAEASASGAGKLSVGPTLRLAVGAADIADVHFDVKPTLAFTASLPANCSLDLVGGSQVGISVGPFQLNQPLPAPKLNLARCVAPPPATKPKLTVSETAPLGAFLDQELAYTVVVRNTGSGAAHGVTVVDTLPGDGTFVSSAPAGSPANPAAGHTYTIALGDLAAGAQRTVTVRWRAPGHEAVLTNRALVRASNADQAGPASASVPVGTTARCNPCGADAAGTGLRNRDHGSITIGGLPRGATVGRAVLVWGILYDGALPRNTITFNGHTVSADVASSVSGNLCWGDTATVGYAADVTPYVTGNGTYNVTDPPRGTTRPDSDPNGELPFTDGATLVVFYVGGGSDNQVLSDFSYDTNTDADQAIDRSFSGIHSVGGPASLILAGPDGQSNFGEVFTFTGASTQDAVNTFDGSDPEDGPNLDIGNLWDTDRFDVGALLPAGQSTFAVDHHETDDCVGVGATVLQVSQRP